MSINVAFVRVRIRIELLTHYNALNMKKLNMKQTFWLIDSLD